MTHQHPGPAAVQDAMNTECTFFQENAEAFALHAVEGAERSQMERHMLWCGPCRRGLAEVRRVTGLLPFLSPPALPSPSVKARLFERLAEETTDDGESIATFSNPWIRTTLVDRPERGARNKTQTGAWQRWIAPGLIAPLAICLIVLSAWTNSLRNEVSMLRSAEASRTSAIVGAPPQSGMQLYTFRPACEKCKEKQAAGQFGGNPEGSVGVVVAWDLDPNEKHQVWCVDSQGQKRLVSDLEVEQTGSVFQAVSFPEPIGGYEQIYVAQHDGTADPAAELLVAMNGEHEVEASDATPGNPVTD